MCSLFCWVLRSLQSCASTANCLDSPFQFITVFTQQTLCFSLTSGCYDLYYVWFKKKVALPYLTQYFLVFSSNSVVLPLLLSVCVVEKKKSQVHPFSWKNLSTEFQCLNVMQILNLNLGFETIISESSQNLKFETTSSNITYFPGQVDLLMVEPSETFHGFQ